MCINGSPVNEARRPKTEKTLRPKPDRKDLEAKNREDLETKNREDPEATKRQRRAGGQKRMEKTWRAGRWAYCNLYRKNMQMGTLQSFHHSTD